MPTTPTANISSKSSPNHQIPSRHTAYDHQVPLSPPSRLAADLTSPQGPSHQTPPVEDVSTRRPTKRRRTSRTPNMAAVRASSSSDSSSQSGMADNETEAERSQHSERSAPQTTAPPKKKRTRTLTTPHQSAVLHALLAKSRFPTTAMREEVGRQIGLSARKVQIWFQNQRQKARRPQGESAPLSRPPQFGPFPIMSSAIQSYPSPSAEASPSGPSSSRRESRGSLDSNPPLSGPGVSNWPSSSRSLDDPRRASSPKIPMGNSLSEDNSTRDSRGSTHGIRPQSAQASPAETSPRFSRVLPPINLSALEPRSNTEPYVSATSCFPPQSSSRASSSRSIEPASPVRPSIPPPFALQPQPRWDRHAFTPYTRPEFASWSHTPGSSLSSARTSISAAGTPNARGRYFYPSTEESRRPAPLDPLSHHISVPSQGQRLLTSAHSSRVSESAHARSDNKAGEE